MTLATFPPPRRRLRLGMVGGAGGFIGPPHADGARLSGRWDIVAGALSSNPDRGGVALPAGLLDFPTVVDGARGVKFLEAALESHRRDGAWVDCRLAV